MKRSIRNSFSRSLGGLLQGKISLQVQTDLALEGKKLFSGKNMNLWFFFVLVWRVVNSLSIITYFQLDEYYQALEPLYYVVFGKGSLTWEWHQQLRSFAHPLVFAICYKLCQLNHWGSYAVRVAPKLAQLVISAIGEYHIYSLLLKVTRNVKVSQYTLILSLTSCFNWFFITRTFANNLEMTLTVVALNWFPFGDEMIWSNYVLSISLAFVSCIIRPTNAITWIYLGSDLLVRSHQRFRIVLVTMLLGTCVLVMNVGLDYIFYQELTLPLWNFFQFNVVSGLSKFYGTNSLSFYLVQAIPVIMTTYTPFLCIGIWQVLKLRNKSVQKLLVVCVLNLILFSSISHKEFRFIYPLMPFFMIFASYGFIWTNRRLKKSWAPLIVILLITNVFISYYMTRIHESGVISVVDYLVETVPEDESIGFLMPCHSTPLQSYFNSNHKIWALSCEPPLQGQHLDTYMDESDIFYNDQLSFLEKFDDWTDYLVVFDALPSTTKHYLQDTQNYKQVLRIFNSRLHWDSRRNGDLIVYSKLL